MLVDTGIGTGGSRFSGQGITKRFGALAVLENVDFSMGMGEAVDLTAIEQFIARMRQENEEFRQYAEQAILVRVAGGGCGGSCR